MRKTIYILSILAAVAVLAATASAHRTYVAGQKERASFTVGPTQVRWQSSQSFDRDTNLAVWVMVDRHSLDNIGSGCTSYFAGRGVAVRLAVCGKGPLKATMANLTSHPVTVRITYQVQP